MNIVRKVPNQCLLNLKKEIREKGLVMTGEKLQWGPKGSVDFCFQSSELTILRVCLKNMTAKLAWDK